MLNHPLILSQFFFVSNMNLKFLSNSVDENLSYLYGLDFSPLNTRAALIGGSGFEEIQFWMKIFAFNP